MNCIKNTEGMEKCFSSPFRSFYKQCCSLTHSEDSLYCKYIFPQYLSVNDHFHYQKAKQIRAPRRRYVVNQCSFDLVDTLSIEFFSFYFCSICRFVLFCFFGGSGVRVT